MDVVGAFEAENNLSSPLERVAGGERSPLRAMESRHAMLVPVHPTEGRSALSHGEIVEGLRELRRQVKSDASSVQEMVRQGRRF